MIKYVQLNVNNAVILPGIYISSPASVYASSVSQRTKNIYHYYMTAQYKNIELLTTSSRRYLA